MKPMIKSLTPKEYRKEKSEGVVLGCNALSMCTGGGGNVSQLSCNTALRAIVAPSVRVLHRRRLREHGLHVERRHGESPAMRRAPVPPDTCGCRSKDTRMGHPDINLRASKFPGNQTGSGVKLESPTQSFKPVLFIEAVFFAFRKTLTSFALP